MNTTKTIIKFMASHPTAANLLMILFVLLGLMTVNDLRRETMPDFSSNEVSITAMYPGATAQEIESSICNRIEDAIDEVSDIDEIRSEAKEGMATVIVKLKEGADSTNFLNDIKTEVEAINDFPDEVEDVIVKSRNRTDRVVSIAVIGPMKETDLKRYCENIKDRLKRINLISQVNISGFSDHQLLVEIPFYVLVKLGLSVSDIANVIKSQSIDLPAGALENNNENKVIRFAEERRTKKELENLIVIADSSGAEIRLGDIAKITNRFEDKESKIIFNGKRAGLLQINKSKKEDALKIVDAVTDFLENEKKMSPPGVEFILTQNVSSIVKDRIKLLLVNGIEGLLLVFLTMWLFFAFRFSFWVAMGLPVSFLCTIFVMKQIDFSINMLSMVGLLIAIGLLMDDAIVIAENIAANLEKGKKSLDAVVDGISEVASGVLSSFLTTLFIFGSLALFMEGDIGKVLYAIPVVLIITLSVSLVEAFFILPNHLSHSVSVMRNKENKFKQKFNQGVEWVRENFLGRVIDCVITWRYLFIGFVIFIFILSISMIGGGYVKFIGFPETDGDVLQARILLPQGTPLSRTEQVVRRVVTAMKQVNSEMTPLQPDQKQLIENFSIIYGQNSDANESGSHVATVSLDLLSAENRNAQIDDIINRWRNLVGDVPDVINIAYKELAIGPGGLPIHIRLQGENLDQLKKASMQLMDWFYTYEGVFDLSDDLRPGKPEIVIRLLKGAMAKGVNSTTIASQLRAAFQGITASEIQRDDESFSIDVRMAEIDSQTLTDLERFHVITQTGKKVPLSSVASLSYERGFARIARINAMRTVTVTGDVDTRIANANQIINDTKKRFIPELKKRFPSISLSLEGETKETGKSMNSMGKAFLIGIFGVFALLSIQFRSYIEPVIVMVTIPFALIGVIWGHIFMGLDLSMPSMIGFISLAGIVVNDSILLVSFIKLHSEAGENAETASQKASRDRFRAVLLTSLTTIMGLLPLLSEKSMQAQILIPLACSIVFGLLASTVLVLLVIPSLYAILGDFKQTEKRGSLS